MNGRSAMVTENDARRALVDACLRMNALGINQGKAGNASMRWDRGRGEGLLITPSALAYESMQADDIVWMPLAGGEWPDDGTVPPGCDGQRPPSSEWRMHRDAYLRRPEIGAVVHSHAVFASTLACSIRVQREGIPPFHYMVAVAGGTDIRCARYETFGTQALSDAALEALRDRRACLLANHGLLALGENLSSALALAVEVEALSRMYWQLLQLGDPVVLDDARMREVIGRFDGYR